MYFDMQSDLLVDRPHAKNTVVNDSAIILLTLHNIIQQHRCRDRSPLYLRKNCQLVQLS